MPSMGNTVPSQSQRLARRVPLRLFFNGNRARLLVRQNPRVANRRFGRTHMSINRLAANCFSISGMAFFACGLGLAVNQYLTGILAVAGTAAIGLVYLAIGVFNLQSDRATDASGVESETAAEPAYGHDVSTITEAAGFPPQPVAGPTALGGGPRHFPIRAPSVQQIHDPCRASAIKQ
jgi:hypothetical protein